MFDIPKIKEDVQQIIELAELMNIMQVAKNKSAKKACEKYIKDNRLEYIQEEIEEAFKKGFVIGLEHQKEVYDE